MKFTKLVATVEFVVKHDDNVTEAELLEFMAENVDYRSAFLGISDTEQKFRVVRVDADSEEVLYTAESAVLE